MTPNVILRSSLAATLGWLALAAAGGLASAAPMVDPRGGSVAPLSAGSYAWPVQGPVLHGFEPPQSPFGAGHRGIDIGAPYGSDMVAAQDGTVAFAGWVGGSLFISIDHPDGVRSTYSWLSEVLVAKGADVSKGELIGRTGHGHPDVVAPHLHFGTRIGDTYVDPMLYLERGSVVGLIHLAPLAEDPAGRMEQGSAFAPHRIGGPWTHHVTGAGPPGSQRSRSRISVERCPVASERRA